MKIPHLTVVQKITAGYLLIAFFSLLALVYALGSLHAQTERSEALVHRDFSALNLARELRANLLAQERLEKQYLVLRDKALLDLLARWRDELDRDWRSLSQLHLPSPVQQRVLAQMEEYRQKHTRGVDLLRRSQWLEATSLSQGVLSSLRTGLLQDLEILAADQEGIIDSSLLLLSSDSEQAFRITLALVFVGIALSAPAALTVVLGIHRSVKALTRGAKEIASGSFDYRVRIVSRDEFGQLAGEFAEMGRKLAELEQLRLDANPLTHLPGNRAIDRAIESRFKAAKPFAHMYLDLDHFKAFGDRYGYKAGSEVLARTGEIIHRIAFIEGESDDMVGHIGGDDYVILTSAEKAERIAQKIIEEFDRTVPQFYSPEDQAAGYFLAQDRFGVERKFPLLTLSIAVILSENLETQSSVAISRECARMKEHLKSIPGSNYLIDRRKLS